ncbi:hypothetical protein RB594_008790 [Gaeumannomyces avenae]
MMLDDSSLPWPDPSHAFVAVATLAVFLSLRRYLYPRHPSVIPGPLKTALPGLAKDEVERLDYRPDAFPGARDVVTPYGSMRVYEWGPEQGRKVLFIHGISTSCQTLTKLAHGLVARGCRVLLFDLWGRGFSDGVGDLPHDARLYVSQALCALASSPLAWTGDDGFDLAGYSLGGGIAVHFAAAFPRPVRSLTLLAPAGMIRPESFGAVTRWVFTAGLVPERLLAALTRRKLQQPIANSAVRGQKAAQQQQQQQQRNGRHPTIGDTKESKHVTNPVELATSEMQHPAAADEPAERLERRVMRYVRWMLENHGGFVPAFMSTIRAAPLMGQDEAYGRLGGGGGAGGRRAGTTLVVLGGEDEIIDPDLYEHDALPLLGGHERVRWRVLPGASHDFPMTHAPETLKEMDDFWAAYPAAEEAIA